MRSQDKHQLTFEVSEYLKGLQALFESMDDGPIAHLEAFQMVQLLKPANEKIDRLLRADR